ncbi:MAG: glucose-1-phosphate adenylyltransferase subunit GlgD [Clostridiales bacterium]|jgi:glucose-1-phosphate adenylyltransferase|nr:glucose-1-phosphate adenylyltransferase subunit GlgD [Clostridiales bacterium]
MKAVGVVFSNIHDKEIKELTAYRTVASIPFGGRYRLIDFVLSNLVNSGVTNVGIITKYNYQSLMDHVGSGKNWDLSRMYGGLTILPPFGRGGSNVYSSRFEAIMGAAGFLKGGIEKYVIMSDCDNVCSIDYNPVLERHIAVGADITLVYREKEFAGNDEKVRTLLKIDEAGRINEVIFAKARAGKAYEYTNILVISKELLFKLIDSAAENGIQSFSRDVLGKGTKRLRIFGYRFDKKFASINNLTDYYKHSMELLDKKNRDELFRAPGGNIYTKVGNSPPLRLLESSKVRNSIIADGCVIEGEVVNSILFRDVHVEKGAKIANSIVFEKGRIQAASRLNCVVADKSVTILKGRELSGHETHPYFLSKGSII